MRKLLCITVSLVLLLLSAVPVYADESGWRSERVYDEDEDIESVAWYYYDNGVSVRGWRSVKNKWYYFDEDFAYMYSDTYAVIDGKTYCFDKNGVMKSSCWYLVDNGGESCWFYLSSNGSAVKGWKKISGKWYYFEANSGIMQTGWLYDEAKDCYYYLDESGAMLTGWRKLSLFDEESWHYFGTDGAERYGWQKINGVWYYFDDDGVMQTGWRRVSGAWYYLNSDGKMQTGWLRLDDKWYYLEASGKMRTADFTYKGKVYKFNKSGVCINP